MNKRNDMKKILFFLILSFFGLSTIAQVPTWQWATDASYYNNINFVGEGGNVSLDASENVYFCGFWSYCDTMAFGNDTLVSDSGYPQIFLTKYNASGNLIWAKGSQGNGNILQFPNLVNDVFGNVYLTGSYSQGPVSFGSYTLDSSSQSCFYLVKYDSSGTILWVRSSDTSSNIVSAVSESTDINGNIYVTGTFNSPTITFGSFTLTNQSYENIFIVKYNSSGNVIWAKSPIDNGLVESISITTDPASNSYITGNYDSSSVVFGNDTLIYDGQNSFYIAKYDSSGHVLWAKDASSSYYYERGNIVTTSSSNYVYVTGSFSDSTISFDSFTLVNPNYSNNWISEFLIKYDSSGNVIWANLIYSYPNGGIFNLCSDINGNFYISGAMPPYPANFDTITLQVPGGSLDPLFIVKYDSSGHALWGLALASGGDDLNGVALSPSNNIYIGGDFMIYPFIIGNDTLNNYATEIPFLAKLGFGSLEGITYTKKVHRNISLYPNPTSCTITLSYNSQTPILNSQLKIYDVLGQEVYTQAITNPNQTTINVSQLSNGVYFYQLTNNTETYRGKFVKE